MKLRVGTDCSGIEAPIQALKQLGIQFEHVFSSDIDKYVIQSIKANYNPQIIFGDKDGPYSEGNITQRDIKDVPDIDVYIAGFPCQSFSLAGNRLGFSDKRGIVFFSCLEVIKIKQPSYFILENVKGLLSHDKGNTFRHILNELESLYSYNIHYKVLNTKDYGIPQSRGRVFIVGIHKNIQTKVFNFPKKKKMHSLTKYVDTNDNNSRSLPPRIIKAEYMSKIPKDSLFVDLNFYGKSTFPNSGKICPCICRKSEIWCVPKNRFANCKELLSLQGFPKNFKQVVSDTQFKKQIGNSMSVNILTEIFIILFK